MKNFEIKLLTSAGVSVLMVIHWSYQTYASNDFSIEEEVDYGQELMRKLRDLSRQNRSLVDIDFGNTEVVLGRNLIRLLSTIYTGTPGDDNLTSVISPNSTSDVFPIVVQLISDVFGGNTSHVYFFNATEAPPEVVNSTSLATKRKYIKKLNNGEIKKLEDELMQAINSKGNTRSKDPRGVFDDIMTVLGTVERNSTNATSPMLKSAMNAVAVLNRLGLLEPITDFIQYEIEFLANDY